MSRMDTRSPSVPPPALSPQSTPTPDASQLDGIAARALQGPLSGVLAGICAVLLLTWVPHYLAWPWYADHDVFATMARAWDAGRLPYRETLGNNFPGTIYMFWL